MRVIMVPIEPLVERYSADWIRWFQMEFSRRRIPYIEIMPTPLSDKIRDGSFLDVCGTNNYKALQLAILCEMAYNDDIKDDDVIFIMDAWFPGIEMLAYIRDGLKKNFKIVGCLFAGTWDPFDFLSHQDMQYWAKSLEESWFRIFDAFFIATEFHKRLIRDSRDVDPAKLVVTGHPIYYELTEEQEDIKKENIVVFPHRLNLEKNPDKFRLLSTLLKEEHPDWKFVLSKEVTRNKKEYWDLLLKSKIAVSCADQETFGFAMIEAVYAGCYPVVPDRLSYAEMYVEPFKYNSYTEMVRLVHQIIKADDDEALVTSGEYQKKYLKRIGESAIDNMIKVIREIVR